MNSSTECNNFQSSFLHKKKCKICGRTEKEHSIKTMNKVDSKISVNNKIEKKKEKKKEEKKKVKDRIQSIENR